MTTTKTNKQKATTEKKTHTDTETLGHRHTVTEIRGRTLRI